MELRDTSAFEERIVDGGNILKSVLVRVGGELFCASRNYVSRTRYSEVHLSLDALCDLTKCHRD